MEYFSTVTDKMLRKKVSL